MFRGGGAVPTDRVRGGGAAPTSGHLARRFRLLGAGVFQRPERVGTDGAHQAVEIIRAAHLLQLCACRFQAAGDVQALRLVLVAGLGQEVLQGFDMPSPQGDVALLLHLQALAVPVGFQQVLAGEHLADVGVVHVPAFILAGGHDVEQRTQGRAGFLHAAVVEVALGHLALGLDDVVDAVHEHLEILQFGLENLLGEDLVGIVEDLTQETVHETVGDAVTETTGQHLLAPVLEVLQFFQVAVFDEVLRIALATVQACPDLGHEQAHVVVHAQVRTDVTGRAGVTGVAGENEGDQRVVQVGRWPQRVERTLGESALAAGTGGAGGLAGEGTDEVHEQLGQFLVVDGVVHRQRADAGLGRVVAPAGQHRVHGVAHLLFQRQLAMKAGADLGHVATHGIHQVQPGLQVTRVLGRLAVHEARMGRGDHVLVALVVGFLQQLAHGLGEAAEGHHVFHHLGQFLPLEGLVVGEEVARLGHVLLRLLVVAGDHGVVGALEEAVFAVLHQLDAVLVTSLFGTALGHDTGGDHHRGGDVVFHLQLLRGDEVLAHLEHPPLVVAVEAHAQVGGDYLAIVELQLVAGGAVHHVHGEVLAPVAAPLLAVEALDHQHQCQDARRNGFEPGIVLVGVARRGGEQLDHRTQAALLAERLARGIAVLVLVTGLEAVAVVAIEDLLDPVEVGLEIINEQRRVDDRVVERLGDLRLAAAGDGAGLVTEGAFGIGAHQAPGRRARMFLHLDLVAVGLDVDLARLQADLLPLAVHQPGDGLAVEVHAQVLGNVDHIGILAIDGVPFRLHVHDVAVALHQFVEAVVGIAGAAVHAELLAVVAAGEGQGAAGVLFLGQAEEVGRVADLGLHLLLAVAVVVVGENGDDDAALVARGDLEGLSVVVQLLRFLPAHALLALALAGLVPVWQAHFLLGEVHQVRCKDDAAAVAAPVFHVQGRIELGQVRVAAIAEDALHEVEIAHQIAGCEEADLHALLRFDTGNLRAYRGTQQQRNEHTRGPRRVGGEGQGHQLFGWVQGVTQHGGEGDLGHRLLVPGDRQSALADVEGALGGTAVTGGVV